MRDLFERLGNLPVPDKDSHEYAEIIPNKMAGSKKQFERLDAIGANERAKLNVAHPSDRISPITGFAGNWQPAAGVADPELRISPIITTLAEFNDKMNAWLHENPTLPSRVWMNETQAYLLGKEMGASVTDGEKWSPQYGLKEIMGIPVSISPEDD